MFRPIEVKALEPYRIWLRYEDGTEGEVDLSDLTGRGVFEAWEDREVFENVRVGEFEEVAWGEEMDLDPYALYMRLTGKSPKELFPGASETWAGA